MENNIEFYDVVCMLSAFAFARVFRCSYLMCVSEIILIAGLFNSNRLVLVNVRTFDKKGHISQRHSIFSFLSAVF